MGSGRFELRRLACTWSIALFAFADSPAAAGSVQGDARAAIEKPRALFFGDGLASLMAQPPSPVRPLLDRLEAQPECVEPVLYSMYDSLARLAGGGALADKRHEAEDFAAARYAGFLSSIQDDGRLPTGVRALARESRRRLLDGSLREALESARRLNEELSELERAADVPEAPDAASPKSERASAAWSRPERVPESRRLSGSGRSHPESWNLPELEARIEDERGKFLRLSALPDQGRFRAEVRRARPLMRDWKKVSDRLIPFTFREYFVGRKPRRALDAPANGGLRLFRTGDGVVLKADFRTDIQDSAVLETVKSSIEGYWRGDFDLNGRREHWRTVVTLKPLPPGKSFSNRTLQLRDGRGEISHARGPILTLGREFGYTTPAHEFGHMLGLDDEYEEDYDPKARAVILVTRPGSLMSSPTGSVLPEHLSRAYALMLERGLVIDDSGAGVKP